MHLLLSLLSKLCFRLIPISLLMFMLTSCGGSDSENKAEQIPSNIDCQTPCLAFSPTVDNTTISSATGGTVTISFQLKGDLSDVFIIISLTDIFNFHSISHSENYRVQDNMFVFTLPVYAGTSPGKYYPNIRVHDSTSANEHRLVYENSQTHYTYHEATGIEYTTPVLTNVAIPIITVTP